MRVDCSRDVGAVGRIVQITDSNIPRNKYVHNIKYNINVILLRLLRSIIIINVINVSRWNRIESKPDILSSTTSLRWQKQADDRDCDDDAG